MTSATKTAGGGGLRRLAPILDWLPTYNRAWLTADVIAGLTLWGLVVHEKITDRRQRDD